jgi:hypothetical protein
MPRRSEEDRYTRVAEDIEDHGWVVVDSRMTAAFTEALRQACQCSGAKDPSGVPVPHDRACPMFPFERPTPNQSLMAFLEADAAFQRLLAAAADRRP